MPPPFGNTRLEKFKPGVSHDATAYTSPLELARGKSFESSCFGHEPKNPSGLETSVEIKHLVNSASNVNVI